MNCQHSQATAPNIDCRRGVLGATVTLLGGKQHTTVVTQTHNLCNTCSGYNLSHGMDNDTTEIKHLHHNRRQILNLIYINGLVQDCSNSIANALEVLQSCAKPSMHILFKYIIHPKKYAQSWPFLNFSWLVSPIFIKIQALKQSYCYFSIQWNNPETYM